MNNRRKLIVALGASVLAAPLRIRAQQIKKSVVVHFSSAFALVPPNQSLNADVPHAWAAPPRSGPPVSLSR